MRKYILGMLLAAVTLASCASPKKIARQVHIKSLVSVETRGYSDVVLIFDVDNDSRKNIHLNDGQLKINDGRKTLARITAADVTLHKRSSGMLEIPLKITLNQLQLLASIDKLANRPEELTVNGSITVKSGMLSKKFNYVEKPLTEFLKEIGLEEDAISKMLEK